LDCYFVFFFCSVTIDGLLERFVVQHVYEYVRDGARRSRPFWLENITEEFAMPTSVVGLFEDQATARKVVSALTKAGCDKDAVEILTDTGVDKVARRLLEAGYEEDKARRYGEVLETAGALIVAEVDDDKADRALETMRKFEVLTPEALRERSGTKQQGKRTEKAQVIQEELEVGVARTTGGKRLTTEVSEREVEETVSLKEETVDVERSRVERTLKPEEADQAFGERTVEVTATTEKPVVSKQAHVVEEVALTKQSGQREETVSGTVRRQDVKVEEIDRKSGSSRKS
jgi:stress response protein YsnF